MHIFNQVSIKEEKRWQERRTSSAVAAAARSARRRDKKQNPYENNNAVTCKQGKNTRLPPPSLPAPHSLGKRATKEMRSAKFLIKGGEQRDGEEGKEAGGGRNERRKRFERLRGTRRCNGGGGGGVRLQVESCHDEAPCSFTPTGDRRQILPKPSF